MFEQKTTVMSLEWLQKFWETDDQLARWLERLQELDFTITHPKGSCQQKANAMSRVPCCQPRCLEIETPETTAPTNTATAKKDC